MDRNIEYRNGQMTMESVTMRQIAAAVGTPCYVYSAAGMERAYRRLEAAVLASKIPTTICFAVKANPNLAVINLFSKLGSGADVVSGGELERALRAGIAAERIVFSGVGKTRAEIARALEVGIGQFNVESPSELAMINRLAAAVNLVAPVVFRVNPDVDAATHAKISTGKKDNKFGIAIDEIPSLWQLALKLPNVKLLGLAVHIGSQINELGPSRQAFIKMRELVLNLRSQGAVIERLDLGGGLAISYRGEKTVAPEDFIALISEVIGDLGCQLILEPGRYLVGDSGVLLTEVLYRKSQSGREFAIVDAAMNDLMRPALYGSYHHIVPVAEAADGAPLTPFDIVGPICESTDSFTSGRELPPLAEGDLLAFLDAGAYGASMSNGYNSRPLVPEVMVKGDRFDVIRPRIGAEEFYKFDKLCNEC
ncbi:MAG: diaminopimelate decarboxylase [Candidatus Pacebacteria bacterium]|nr:diaminopimelate decarboxylase [Candidatus Paceibacterota bacterium]